MAKIMIPTPLRKFTGNQPVLESSSETVDLAIRQLIQTHPALQRHLLDGNDQIRSFVRIFVGDTDYQELQGPATPVHQDTVISIVPAIAGGSPSAPQNQPV